MKSEFNMQLVYTILVKCFQQQANLTLLVIEKGASEHFPHNLFAHESHGASSGPNSPLCSLLDVIIGLTRTLILFNLNEYATRKKICRHKECLANEVYAASSITVKKKQGILIKMA